jgi:hypothetical protein
VYFVWCVSFCAGCGSRIGSHQRLLFTRVNSFSRNMYFPFVAVVTRPSFDKLMCSNQNRTSEQRSTSHTACTSHTITGSSRIPVTNMILPKGMAHGTADVSVLEDVLDQPMRGVHHPAGKFLEQFRWRYTEPWAYGIFSIDGVIHHPAAKISAKEVYKRKENISLCPRFDCFFLSSSGVLVPPVVVSLVAILLRSKPFLSSLSSFCSKFLTTVQSGNCWYDLFK